jgi:hypothetical protein
MRGFSSRMLRGLSAIILAGLLTLAHAGSIEPRKAVLSTAEDGGTTLNAEFSIDLGACRSISRSNSS